jgi:hypothetical protein
LERKLEQIEKRVAKTEKKVRDLSIGLWGIPIGFLIGTFWDDIVNVFKVFVTGS